jgi:two-component system, cell cycle sensor histidine kinase and response regulator CckA
LKDKARSLLLNLLCSGIYQQIKDDVDLYFHFLLLNSICLSGIFFFGFFGIYDLIHGVQSLGLLIIGVAVYLALDLIYLRHTHNWRLASWLGIAAITIGFAFLLATGGSGNTGPLWIFSFPPALIFILGIRTGTVVLIFFLAFVAGLLFYPDCPLLTAHYSDEFKLRFIPALLCVSVLAYVFEHVRLIIHAHLRKRNAELAALLAEVRLAENRLFTEKERLAVTLRSIADGVITTDRQGRVSFLNQVAENLLGCSEDQAAGRPIGEIFCLRHHDTREPLADPVSRVLREETLSLDGPCLLDLSGGGELSIASSTAPIRDSQGRVFGAVLAFRNVTAQLKMEQELLRTRHLESLGLLAGGIAHDFNNILAGISGNLQLARLRASASGEMAPFLGRIDEVVQRAAGLSRQLLTFSKGGAPLKQVTDIAPLLRDIVCFTLSGTNVQPRFNLPPGLWPTSVDWSQLEQVVTNLVLNAQQAMPQGGQVEVAVKNVTASEKLPGGLPPGAYLHVSVADKGPGIPRESLDRLFDPYFTTKPNGTGLGLSSSYSIIHRHGGHLFVESTGEEGTVFAFYLPAVPGQTPIQPLPPPTVAARGRGRILVMDDEELIREMTTEMLGLSGYRVESACDGAEAISKYRRALETDEPFSAVVMDLTISGGMGGREALEKLLRLDPSVKGVVVSGYSNDPVMADFQRYGFKACLTKPFSLENLLAALQETLAD